MSKNNLSKLDKLVKKITSGDATALGQAITFVESRRPDHQAFSEKLLEKIMPKTGKSIRIGITGVPGVGKSTFIEALGLYLVGEGKRVGVLAVDPSSLISRGSILGDKTRMSELANARNVFIRPTPSTGILGGIAPHTREAILLLEAAGHDVILVETVGAGQSETDVAKLVDFFMLLQLPGAGDELQGIKKGVLELADMIVINKADDENRTKAIEAVRDFKAALHIVTGHDALWKPPVLMCSALAREGIESIWVRVSEYEKIAKNSGSWNAKRCDQNLFWMWAIIEAQLFDDFKGRKGVLALLKTVEKEVKTGKKQPFMAAQELLGNYFDS